MKAMVVMLTASIFGGARERSEKKERFETRKEGKDIGCHLQNLRESPSYSVSDFLGVNNTLSDTRGSFRPQKYHVF